MDSSCEVVFYHHSGFTAAVGDCMAVFDYWEGGEAGLAEEKKLTAARLSGYKYVYVFTSHTHPDHLDPVIYSWEAESPVTYIAPFDAHVGMRGRRMAPGDSMDLHEGVRVKAFASTDTGVCYLVDLYGVQVFHAGDLNLWHWREESTLREIEAAENAFEAALASMAGEQVDIAMFPVDPRQGALFDVGANRFILSMKPKVFIPMHWQGRREVAAEFARRAANKATGVYALTLPRERIVVRFEGGVMNIEVYQQEEPPPAAAQTEQKAEQTYGGNLLSGEDPFTDSDMPVELGGKDG